ncbi:MAG: UDP-glucose/GDP-mannose dehydrogenase family protein [Verrucomicrobia bacterium]|nr:UDP-glucose/GDP-mannose dehydrogenase family protein [Verrucomicrobiota bacterium]
MNISVMGLGYVGSVTAACLARRGHGVVGVDVQPQKVEAFNRGESPIVEPGLEELLRRAKAEGRLRATTDGGEAIAATDLSVVCVGTPSTGAGMLDLGYVRAVTVQLGEVLRRRPKPHALVFRSTMLPGSTAALADDVLADLVAAGGLEVFYFPEFLREGSAVADFEHPSLAVVGTRDGAPPAPELMEALFGGSARVVGWGTAEMVKYACNAFHATKIAFANEVGRVAKPLGMDARVVMDLLCEDTRLNISPLYLRPGNPFGGSCLPKDVRAIVQHGRRQGLHLPLLESLLPSNERHLQSLLGLIAQTGQTEAVILGLSFKADTDDLRESAMVEVAQTLLGRGYALRIYDPALNLAALVGSNKRLIDSKMPHLASLLRSDLGAALGAGGVVIVAQRCAGLQELKRFVTPAHHLLDINGWPELRQLPARYEGLCW